MYSVTFAPKVDIARGKRAYKNLVCQFNIYSIKNENICKNK